MDNLYVKAVLAGLFFGIWPLIMNRSGINGNIASFILVFVMLVCIAPFAAFTGGIGKIFAAGWLMVIVAGIFGAGGILFFNDMLAKASTKNVSTLFVLVLIIQIAVPSLYQVFTNGISIVKGFGFLFAALAAVLLLI